MLRMQLDCSGSLWVVFKLLENVRFSCSFLSAVVLTVRRAHERTLLASRLPGSPGSSLLGGGGFRHETEAEPDVPAVVGGEPPAEAEPAPAGQLQDDTAAAAPLHVRSPPVVWPHVQHSAHPHRGIPIRTLHDAVWRQTEKTLTEPQGSYTCGKTHHKFDLSCFFCCFFFNVLKLVLMQVIDSLLLINLFISCWPL